MAYAIGDRVRTKKGLTNWQHYAGCLYIDNMDKDAGKEFTINKLGNDRYFLKGAQDYGWSEPMLEAVEEKQEKGLKFKVGDKVKRVKGVYHGMEIGDISTVVKTGTGPDGTGGIVLEEFGGTGSHDEAMFEIVEETEKKGGEMKYKIGDRVKIVSDTDESGYTHRNVPVGSIATVTSGGHAILLDDNKYGVNFNANMLELAEEDEPVKLVKGKYTQKFEVGDRVEVISDTDETDYFWSLAKVGSKGTIEGVDHTIHSGDGIYKIDGCTSYTDCMLRKVGESEEEPREEPKLTNNNNNKKGKNIMAELGKMFKKLVNKKVRVLAEAGFINGDLELTQRGRDSLTALTFDDYQDRLVKEAEGVLEEQKKEADKA